MQLLLNNSSVDWNTYRRDFPCRYWEQGVIDDFIVKERENYRQTSLDKKLCILDVGGGVYGTQVLHHTLDTVYALDPYITQVPCWVKEHWSWVNLKKSMILFDIIVLRGSLNYLTKEQLFILKSQLKTNGFLFANTFVKPPSSVWSTPRKTEQGWESVFLDENSCIHHKLVNEKSKEVIEHMFYFYDQDILHSIFTPHLRVELYKQNSVLLKYINQVQKYKR